MDLFTVDGLSKQTGTPSSEWDMYVAKFPMNMGRNLPSLILNYGLEKNEILEFFSKFAKIPAS